MIVERANAASLNLNDFDLFWSGAAGEPFPIKIKDPFGEDYETEIRVALSKQDHKFQERFNQFLEYYKRESAEL